MHDEKITPQYEPGDNFFKKLDNFWYHYKWTTIIVSFFAIVFIVCAFQFCSRETRELNVLYSAYEYGLGRYINDVESAFESVSPDRNNDGKSNVAIVEVPIITPESYEAFRNHTLIGDTVICLLSPELYNTVYDKDDDGKIVPRFMKLEEVLGYKPEYAYDDYSVRIGDTPLAIDFPALKKIDNDDGGEILLCMLKKTLITSAEDYEYCGEVFKNIIEYEPVNK